jgi:hypothetical protein
MDEWIQVFKALVLGGGERTATHARRFILGERATPIPSRSGRHKEFEIFDLVEFRSPTPWLSSY